MVSCKFFPSGLRWGHSSTLLCVVKCIYSAEIESAGQIDHSLLILLSMDCFQLVSFFKLKALLFRSFSIHVSGYACTRISLGRGARSRIAGSDLQNNGTVLSEVGRVRGNEPIHTPPKYLDAADPPLRFSVLASLDHTLLQTRFTLTRLLERTRILVWPLALHAAALLSPNSCPLRTSEFDHSWKRGLCRCN